MYQLKIISLGDVWVLVGVPAARITIRAHGETRPMVATPDGVAERKNRRLEIGIALVRKM